tara:strand:- start:3531 stop:3677 length:147 start_codon:yes stop_codon:yes gene_type:complete
MKDKMKIIAGLRDKVNQILDDIAAHLGLQGRAVPVRVRTKNQENKDQK